MLVLDGDNAVKQKYTLDTRLLALRERSLGDRGRSPAAASQGYTWGLDLSGQVGDGSTTGIHGAGGIGGLLAAVETGGDNQGSYWFLYDGNGNVGQVLKASDQSIAARYEYDPYGNQLPVP